MRIDDKSSLYQIEEQNSANSKNANAKDREVLKKACQDFESVFLAQIWKKMMSDARRISGKKDEDRAFGPLEDLAVEMSSEALAGQEDNGLWKVLYDSLVTALPDEVKNES